MNKCLRIGQQKPSKTVNANKQKRSCPSYSDDGAIEFENKEMRGRDSVSDILVDQLAHTGKAVDVCHTQADGSPYPNMTIERR